MGSDPNKTQPNARLTNARLKARLNLAAIVVLVLGLGAGILVYATADEAVPEAAGYIVVDGLKYPIAPNQSKRYIRDLERFGGKASVLFDEFDRWFAELWRGKTLGITIGCLSTAVALGVFLFGAALPQDFEKSRE
jgi:hypothetical protein